MTPEIINNNKLIADFMGYKTWVAENGNVMAEDELTYAGHLSHFACFQYHENWNLLMPVVEKIETTLFPIPVKNRKGFLKNATCSNVCVETMYDDREEFKGWSWRVDYTLGCTIKESGESRYNSKMQAVYAAVTTILTWYNQQLELMQTESIFNEATQKFGNTLKKLPDTEIPEMHIRDAEIWQYSKKLPDTEIPEMHILYNPSGAEDSESDERTLDREELTRTEAVNRNAVLRDSGSDNRWILDIGKARV